MSLVQAYFLHNVNVKMLTKSKAVSVSLPTWEANVAYEEGKPWVIGKMECGYPRFFVHPIIQELAKEVVLRHGKPETETAMLFPSPKTARVCYSFFLSRLSSTESSKVRLIDLAPPSQTDIESLTVTSLLSGVIFPKEYGPIAKQVWQHTGSGISSRRGEFCLDALRDGFLQEKKDIGSETISQRICKGPRRYQGKDSVNDLVRGTGPQPIAQTSITTANSSQEGREFAQFIEERFGRNLSTSLSHQAKLAVRKRIAGVLTADVDLSEALQKTAGGRQNSGVGRVRCLYLSDRHERNLQYTSNAT